MLLGKTLKSAKKHDHFQLLPNRTSRHTNLGPKMKICVLWENIALLQGSKRNSFNFVMFPCMSQPFYSLVYATWGRMCFILVFGWVDYNSATFSPVPDVLN